MLLKDWSAEFVETEELKDPLPVDIEHPQVIRLLQIVLDRLKMPAIRCPCRKPNPAGARGRIAQCFCLMREAYSLVWLVLVLLFPWPLGIKRGSGQGEDD